MINKYALLNVIRGVIREKNEFSLRDLSRKIKISTSTSKEVLDFLLSNDIVEMRQIGRNHLFRFKDTFITKQIRILYSLSELNSSGIVKEILEKNMEILSICVYGSVAKGEDDNKSDIDILVISRKKINNLQLKSEKKIGREVTILNYTYREWKDKAEKDKVFYNNAILNCIQLYGEKPIVI